jgi:putative resolvase
VGVKTLQRWDREGRLKSERTRSGRRAYTKAILDTFLSRTPHQGARTPVAYCRVSRAAHKRDLKNQRRVSKRFLCSPRCSECRIVEESRRRLESQAPKFVALMDRIEARQSHFVIAHKDRLVALAFNGSNGSAPNTAPSCLCSTTSNCRPWCRIYSLSCIAFRLGSTAWAITARNSRKRFKQDIRWAPPVSFFWREVVSGGAGRQ